MVDIQTGALIHHLTPYLARMEEPSLSYIPSNELARHFSLLFDGLHMREEVIDELRKNILMQSNDSVFLGKADRSRFPYIVKGAAGYLFLVNKEGFEILFIVTPSKHPIEWDVCLKS